MRAGEPSIAIRSEGPALVIGVWMMRPGEDKVVARRLRQVLEKKAETEVTVPSEHVGCALAVLGVAGALAMSNGNAGGARRAGRPRSTC